MKQIPSPGAGAWKRIYYGWFYKEEEYEGER